MAGWVLAVTVFGGFYSLCQIANGDDSDLALPAFLFPYAFLYGMYLRIESFVVLILIVAQFPAYGAIFAWAWVKNCQVKVGWRLLVLHLLLGIGCALIVSADDLVR